MQKFKKCLQKILKNVYTHKSLKSSYKTAQNY